MFFFHQQLRTLALRVTNPSVSYARGGVHWRQALTLASLSLLYGVVLFLLASLRCLGNELFGDDSLIFFGSASIVLVYGLSRTKHYLLGSAIFALLHLFIFVRVLAEASAQNTANSLSLAAVQTGFCFLYMAIVIGPFTLPHKGMYDSWFLKTNKNKPKMPNIYYLSLFLKKKYWT